MNSKPVSSLVAKKFSWLSIVIAGSIGVVLLALAAGARVDEGRFVYRTYLFLAGGIGAMAMAIVLWSKK